MRETNSHYRKKFIAEMNAKWERKYRDYKRWLDEANNSYIEAKQDKLDEELQTYSSFTNNERKKSGNFSRFSNDNWAY